MVKRGSQKIKEAKDFFVAVVFIQKQHTIFNNYDLYFSKQSDILVIVILGFGDGKLKTGCFDFIQYCDHYSHRSIAILWLKKV